MAMAACSPLQNTKEPGLPERFNCIPTRSALIVRPNPHFPDEICRGESHLDKLSTVLRLNRIIFVEIGVFEDSPGPLGHKLVEVGHDYVVVRDIANVMTTRIPIYSIKSVTIVTIPKPGK